MNEFVHLLQAANWSSVYNESDINASFNTFSEIMQTSFKQAFPLRKLSRKQLHDKNWVTTAPKK
jgi:hypothetical protein